MPRIEYKTSSLTDGIYLVDKDDLSELDELIEDRVKQFRKVRHQEIARKRREARVSAEQLCEEHPLSPESHAAFVEGQVREAIGYPLTRNSVEWTLCLKSDQKVHAASLREAISDPAIQLQEISEIKCQVQCGRYECTFRLNDTSSYSTYIDVSPATLTESNRCFRDLDGWRTRHRLPQIFCWWQDWRSVFIASTISSLLVIVTGILLLYNPTLFHSEEDESNMSLRRSAEIILENGVDSENQHAALELLLKISLVGEPLPREGPSSVFKFAFLFWSMMFLPVVALSFSPKTIFGVGKSEAKLKWMRSWIRFVSVLVPTFLIMGVMSSVLASWIYEFARTNFFHVINR